MINKSGIPKDGWKTFKKVKKKTIKLIEARYEVGLLWSDELNEMPNNNIYAAAQLILLEKRLEKDKDLQKRYQETIDVDLEKGFVRKIDRHELKRTRNKQQ